MATVPAENLLKQIRRELASQKMQNWFVELVAGGRLPQELLTSLTHRAESR